MWYEIFKFELKYRIKRPDTYLFFVFLFLFSIVGIDFILQGVELGPIKKNSPLVIAKAMGAITGIFMIIASMIMGVSVLRDFEYHIESLMYVNPIRKRDYLLGRFLGSFAVLLFVFSGLLFGMMLGEFMPWKDPNDLHPFNIRSYVQPFVFVTLPIMFFGACLFFITGALSKKIVVVYTQGIVFFVIFIVVKSITNEQLQAILDPFSLTTISLLTESWTVEARNFNGIPFSGLLLYNKLFWIVLGLLILVFGYQKFNFTIVKRKQVNKKKSQVLNIETDIDYTREIPEFQLKYGFKAKWTQLTDLSLFYFKSICKQPTFWAIVICGILIMLVNSVNLGTVHGVDSYPETYFIVKELQETSVYFFLIILVFYSGELIWKERSVKLNLIYDATPISDFIHLAGKYIGLLLIYIVLIISLIISGIIFQTMNGYYNYELQVYFYGFFLEILPFLALYTFIAFFAQVLTNHKFIGILAVMVFLTINIGLRSFGFDHDLYLFGGSPLGTYSDMNGFGHFFKPFIFIKAYWLFFGLSILIISSVFSVRGTESNFLKRLKGIRTRLSNSLLKFGIITMTTFILLGCYIYYNTNVLNKYMSKAETINYRVNYEKTLKKFEYFPQPKIVDVNLKVDLYPSTRDYIIDGVYVLNNTTDVTISEIHIQKLMDAHTALDGVTFDKEVIANNEYNEYGYTIYELKEEMQPGGSITISFKQTFTTNGFEVGGSNTHIVNNGTFFNNKHLPTLGYNKKYELRNTDDRSDHGLPPRLKKAKREDPKELLNPRSGSDSDGITFEIIIGTDENQTAIAPGSLMKNWTENNRNYFHYKMDKTMINFYSIVSAEYEVQKDTWRVTPKTETKPVDLEIYYHKGHDFNLDRMMESMKASFDYYSTNFSPYQYHQMRITEFPRYLEFAQAFPGTVPFSEAIGFVLDIDDETDVDMAFYITAHELAHQWFGMQVEAANVQGQHLILETLSQYAAIMVLKKHYSEDKVQQFLKLQVEKYSNGKRIESGKEPSLAFVENQEYVYYAKGAINMYELQEYIGEDKVNLAIKQFISDWNTTDGKLKMRTNRYATTKDLLGYFKNVTPEELQYLIHDLFEKVIPMSTPNT